MQRNGLTGWPEGTHTKLSSLSLNPDQAINCHPGVSQAGKFIDACAVSQMDDKLLYHLRALVCGR